MRLNPPPSSSLSPQQISPYLARLIVAGEILRLPSLRRFLTLLPSPLPSHHLPLSLSRFVFPLFSPPSSITLLFNLLLRRSLSRRRPALPFSLFSFLLRLSPPDRFTFPPLLAAAPALPLGRQLHSQVLKRGVHSDTYVLNNLLTMYARFGCMPAARTLLDSCREYSDVVTWNVVVNGYVKVGDLEAARKVFDEMPVRDEVSWSAMIGGYAGNGEMDVARYLFERMPDVMGKSVVTWNSMVAGFARCGMLGLARKYFDEMPERNLVSWNAMVSGYAMNGEMDEAMRLFEVMRERDVVSWSCMIGGYAQSRRYLEAMTMFEVMVKESGVKPNELTMVSALSACAHLSALDQGKWIHRYIDRNGMVLDDDCNVGAALIDMYFKCCDLESALWVFDSLDRKNVSSWNALITGLGISGLASDALSAFEQMQRSGTKPNGITFLGVLTACTHGGLVEEGRRYFKRMSEAYGVQPEMKHYGCMVDLLGRAGLLEEAEAFVKRMPMKPDIMVFGALLGACRIHNNVDIAEKVQNDFIRMNSQQAGCHVLLSNIYAAADRWADASKMREILEEKGIEKKAGASSVELDAVG